MKKANKKVSCKKNNVNVKEKCEMRKMNELEGFMFVEAMQNMMGHADEMKLIVHENLFENMVILLKNEGFNMSFIDSQYGTGIKEAAIEVEKSIGQGLDYEDDFLENLFDTFLIYLELGEDTKEFVEYVNNQSLELKLNNFFSKYLLCVRMNYHERQDFIQFLCRRGQEYKDKGNTIAYDRTVNYLSLLIMNHPSAELSRSLHKIVENHVNDKSA